MRDLASPVAYKVMNALATRSRKKLAQQIRREVGVSAEAVTQDVDERLERLLQDAELASTLGDVRKTHDELKSGLTRDEGEVLLETLERLSALGVVRRGFRLNCPNCATPSWHPLDALRERVACQGCSHVFPLPVRAAPGGPEIRFHYTLNSLVDRVMDQNVLPSILALHNLTRDKEAACIVPGLDLVKDDRTVHEFDFVFVADGQVYAGECKAGHELGDKDFQTAQVAATLGIRHFYFVSPAGFSDETLKRVEVLSDEFTAVEEGMSVEVLGPSQLLVEQPVGR